MGEVRRSEGTEFRYRRKRQQMPRLWAWREELNRLLAANEAKSGRERLRGLSHEGGCDAVRRQAQGWRRG